MLRDTTNFIEPVDTPVLPAEPVKVKPKRVRKPEPNTVARKLLRLFGPNGENWCQGMAHMTRNHRNIKPKRGLAHCLVGGITFIKAKGEDKQRAYVMLHGLIGPRYGSIPSFNDHNPWPAVKAKLQELHRREKAAMKEDNHNDHNPW